MEFLNPSFVGALAVVALPLLIHLLMRDRIRKVAFSTLRFFVQGSEKLLRRKKFQEMLLLALRMLIMALVALVFARPFLRAHDQQGAQINLARNARVIVADVSGSVGLSGSTEALRKAAREALGELNAGSDAAALMTFDDAPHVVIGMANDFGAVRTAIDGLTPGQGGTDIAEALRQADVLLREVKAGRKDIVLISDLQRNGWAGGGSALRLKLAADVKLQVRMLPPPPPSLTISELDCPESLVMDNAPHNVAVRLLNQTAQEIKDQPATLAINGKVVATRKVNLKANASGAVRFAPVFDHAGDNAGMVYLGADSPEAAAAKGALEKIFFNVRATPRIKVVILNGTPSRNPLLDGAYFLAKALAPETNSAFAVKTVSAEQATSADLADAKVVIAASVSKVSASVQAALGELLRRGGGLLLLPGETVDAKEFNATFAGLAPCQLRRVLTAANAEGGEAVGATITKLDFEHPVFEIFVRPHHGDLSLARFTRWWEVGDSQTATVPARFDDNRPAVLERQVGRGIAMLLASSPDLRWSNLPLRAVFLPYLHQTVRYLAIRAERRTAFQAGQVVEAPQGCRLQMPSGKFLTSPDGKVALNESGICTWLNADGKPDYAMAVNAARQEAATATVSAEELIAAVQQDPSETGAAADALRDDSFKARLDRNDFWWYLAAVAAALFVLELALANNTLRH